MLPDVHGDFNFAAPAWLWGLALLPALWLLYALFFKARTNNRDLAGFADAHLLPHLLAGADEGVKEQKRLGLPLAAWSAIFALGLVAMAGPRWGYSEVKAFASTRDLVILLDLAKSMDAQDVKPTRLTRAREEIEDIAEGAKAVNIGFIVFDSVPHMITPLTDDRQTMIHLLPTLDTSLSYVPGNNLAPALDMARDMLASAPGRDKNVLVISDGGFEDSDAAIYRAEKKLTDKAVHVNVMGVGTKQGAPVRDKEGFIQKDGAPELFRIDEDRLKRVAADGDGIYATADYFNNGTRAVLSQVEGAASDGNETGKTARFWNERFYIFLLPALLLLLPWFRRNAAFPLAFALLLSLPGQAAQAFEWRELFLNKDQQGQQALENRQYDTAEKKFDDPYRRGVAQYRAGKYDEAAKSFAAVKRPGVTDSAEYDLGNAQLMSGKVKDAIATYEDVLKKNSNQENARHNLEIAKKLLEQQQQQQQQSSSQNEKQAQQNKQNQKNQQSQSGQQQKQDKQNKQGQQPQSSQQQGEQNKQDQQSRSAEQKRQDEQQQAEQQKQDEQNKQGQQPQSSQQQGEQNKQDQQSRSAEQKRQDDQRQAEQQKQDEKQSGQEQEQQQAATQPDEQNGEKKQPGKDEQDVRRSTRDIDADQWIDRIQNEPDTFMKNKFYIETLRQSKKGEETP